MLSSEVFRFAKPGVAVLTGVVKAASVGVTTTPFVDSIAMSPKNRALFDVVAADGRVLNRAEGFEPDYWFEGGNLVVRQAGSYSLREYDKIGPFEDAVIKTGRNFVLSDGGAFRVGVPFWPQVLSQPENGVARVSNDGKSLAYVSQGFRGQASFAYRMVNAYGQVSEPACAYITAI